MQTTVPPYLEQIVATCPQTGSHTREVHRWLLKTANRLRHYIDAEFAFDLLVGATANCGRRVPDTEIREALGRAYGGYPAGGARGKQAPLFAPDLDCINQVVEREYKAVRTPLKELRAVSRTVPASADEIIARLFPGNPLLCVGVAVNGAMTAPRASLCNIERFRLIVPSPMSAKEGLTQDGRPSARCLANTGPRRFLVTDFDIKPGPFYNDLINSWAPRGLSPQDIMAALLLALRRTGPLCLVVHSGNMSLQGWWFAQGEDESHLRKWFSKACALGADPAAWTTCQFFRLPWACRIETGRIQEPIYFNPEFFE
jgi:hypothetical protein